MVIIKFYLNYKKYFTQSSQRGKVATLKLSLRRCVALASWRETKTAIISEFYFDVLFIPFNLSKILPHEKFR